MDELVDLTGLHLHPVLVPILRRDGELDLTEYETALLIGMSVASSQPRWVSGWVAGSASNALQ